MTVRELAKTLTHFDSDATIGLYLGDMYDIADVFIEYHSGKVAITPKPFDKEDDTDAKDVL